MYSEHGKDFNQSSKLVRHNRIHSDKNPYEYKSVGRISREAQILSYARECIMKGSHIYVMNVGRSSIKAQIL